MPYWRPIFAVPAFGSAFYSEISLISDGESPQRRTSQFRILPTELHRGNFDLPQLPSPVFEGRIQAHLPDPVAGAVGLHGRYDADIPCIQGNLLHKITVLQEEQVIRTGCAEHEIA